MAKSRSGKVGRLERIAQAFCHQVAWSFARGAREGLKLQPASWAKLIMKGPRKREASQPAYDLRFRAPALRVPWKMELGENFFLVCPQHVEVEMNKTESIRAMTTTA